MRVYMSGRLVFELRADVRWYAVARLNHREPHRVCESGRICTAVTLDDDAREAHHARAIVAARIEPLLEPAQRRARGERGERAPGALAEFLADRARDHPRRAFHRL